MNTSSSVICLFAGSAWWGGQIWRLSIASTQLPVKQVWRVQDAVFNSWKWNKNELIAYSVRLSGNLTLWFRKNVHYLLMAGSIFY
jgi:hypothetical protein